MLQLLTILFGALVLLVRIPVYALRAILISRDAVAEFRDWERAPKRFGIFPMKQSKTHGDADWAKSRTLKERGHLKAEGWLVGLHEGKRIYTGPEASGIAIAAKGQGKTQSAIAQLRDLAERQLKEDVIVVDPAGDLHQNTAAYFRERGYMVRTIDFTNPHESDRYDVFTVLKPHQIYNFDRQVDQLCELVLPDDKHTREGHFQEFGRLLLAGMIVHLVKNEPENATLYNAVSLLTTDAERRKRVFAKMWANGDALVKQAVSAFSEAGDKERGSFSTTLARKLRVWLRAAVHALTETGERNEDGALVQGWSWEEVYLQEQPVATYIITGLGTGEGAAARLILGNAINTRRDMWNATRRKPPKGLRLLVDEAREIGNCNAIMDANNELRKAGVNVMMWFLSSRDIFDIYPQAATLIQNSDLIIFGGSKEKSFMEDVSWLVGEKTIDNPSVSYSENGTTEGASEQAQRVIKPDAIRRLGYYEMMAVLNNIAVKCEKPFKLGKKGPSYP